MDIYQAQTFQKLCELHNAIGCEVWFVGIRFYLATGKMSKIYSRQGLGLEIGQVWINLQNFKNNVKQFRFKYHPDRPTKDKTWSKRLYEFVELHLLSKLDSRDRVTSAYFEFWRGGVLHTSPENSTTPIRLARTRTIDELKAKGLYRQF